MNDSLIMHTNEIVILLLLLLTFVSLLLKKYNKNKLLSLKESKCIQVVYGGNDQTRH